MKKPTFLILLIINLFCIKSAFSQVDTSFWFVAPEVSSNQVYGWWFDRPVYFHFSTLNDPATVTLSIPANPNFTPVTFNIAANSSYSYDITSFIDSIENKPSNTILNKGVKISSTAKINTYYEVVSTYNTANPELFALKGKNALGLEFYIPGQNSFSNASFFNYLPTPYSSFDIIATEDNTIVTITPINPIVGHSANTPFTITLNKGQTFNCMATSQLYSLHLVGSHVVSNKPIAITISDDLLQANNLADLSGDQAVPITRIGKEYIAIKSQLDNNLKCLFITATQNNTNIYFDGSTTATTTLNTGQTYSTYINNASTYIKADKDIYVTQLAGVGGELGMAVLPYIPCTGSKKVSYKRATTRPLDFCILVKNGDQGGFLFNGSSSVINASSFVAVPGTSGNWLAARISISTSTLPVNSYGILTNTLGLFHLGIVEGQSGYGAGYGYFSDYSSSEMINIYTNHSPSNNFCIGDTLILYTDTLASANYTWSGPNGFASNFQNPTHTNISALDSGIYTLNVSNYTCLLDPTPITIHITSPTINLPPDTTICSNTPITLTPTGNFTSLLWSTGATTPFITVNSSGTYWVKGSIGSNCTASDTIHITLNQSGQFSLGNDTTICNLSQFSLTAPGGSYSYLWSNGSTNSTLNINQTGQYWLEIDNSSICPYRDTIQVTFSAPSITLPSDTIICGNSQVTLIPTGTYTSLLWSTGAVSPTINATSTGTYWVKGFLGNNCFASDSMHITVLPSGQFSLGNDTTLCDTSHIVLTAPSGGYTLLWSTGSINNSVNVQQTGLYWLEIDNDSICPYRDSINIAFVPIPTPNLGTDITLCSGSSLLLNDGLNSGTSIWSTGNTGHSVNINTSGTYWVVSSSATNCNNSDTIVVVTVQPTPFSLGLDTMVCENQVIILSPGSGFDSYQWSTGDTTSVITISQPGNYSVLVTNGPCKSSDYINILPCPCVVWAPNTFTPNNDGFNDCYNIAAFNISYLNMQIFNRWGELLYEQTDINAKWDGRYKGKMCPEGVYFCVFKYKCDFTYDKLYQSHTSVTLIK